VSLNPPPWTPEQLRGFDIARNRAARAGKIKRPALSPPPIPEGYDAPCHSGRIERGRGDGGPTPPPAPRPDNDPWNLRR